MTFEQFEVVVVPFPFVDSTRRKPRPALALSSRAFGHADGHSILAMITRGVTTRWPSDHPIDDLGPTGLRHPSVVRWKIFTLDNRVISRRIGRLAAPDARACGKALAGLFDFGQ
jgi:mRNA-degrading endonuclease toxin of MazEF toxin-antitoxin module